MASLVQRLGVGQEAVHPRKLVSELRAGLRIAVRSVQAADDHAVRGGLEVPALRVGWIAGQFAASLHRLSSPWPGSRHHSTTADRPIERRNRRLRSAGAGTFIRDLELLQADDVGFGAASQRAAPRDGH